MTESQLLALMAAILASGRQVAQFTKRDAQILVDNAVQLLNEASTRQGVVYDLENREIVS